MEEEVSTASYISKPGKSSEGHMSFKLTYTIYSSILNNIMTIQIEMSYRTTSSKIPTTRYFLQNDQLSCSFFNIMLEMIVKIDHIQANENIFKKSYQNFSTCIKSGSKKRFRTLDIGGSESKWKLVSLKVNEE